MLGECHVVVLAAGRGRRMGGPKALLRLPNGRLWWQEQLERIRALGISATWVVSEDVMGALQSDADRPEGLVVADSSAPMFASVIAGLRSAARIGGPWRGVFVLPVDTPCPDRPTWEALAAAGSVAAPTMAGKSGHPLYLPRTWVRDLLARVGDHEVPAAMRLDEVVGPVCRAVEVADADCTVNLNTPEDARLYFQGRGGAAR